VKTLGELAFGAWAIGGRSWGPVTDESERIAAVQRGFELGIRFFDTAPTYGDSERLLGRIFASHREQVSIATKVGPLDDPRSSLEASLERLGTDHVDLFQLHELAESWESSLESMNRLREEGKARALGLCNASHVQLRRALEIAPVAAFQEIYNLFDRDVEERMLPLCEELRIDFMAYRPLASGLLTGKFSSRPQFAEDDHRNRIYWFRGKELERRAKVLERLRPIAERGASPVSGIALGWLRSRPGVGKILMGARTPAQVESNVRNANPLSESEVAEVDRIVAEVYRPPRATAALLEAAQTWGERERFIIQCLDGKTSYEAIAAGWSDSGGKPMIAAQVKTFADRLATRGLLES
jgi:myo-inositol catabolism protein IolS